VRIHLSAEQFARGGPRRSLYYRHALAGEDLVERAGELGVTVPDEEAEGAGPVAEVPEQVAGLLGGPRAAGWAVTPRMCACRVATSLTNRMDRRLRKTVSAVKRSQASRPSAGVRRNARQGVPAFRGAGLGRRAQDPPHGAIADLVAEPG